MNGFTVDDEQHERALASFWELYRGVDPGHAVYERHASNLNAVVPLMYHGDEGRGRLKRAVLVTSYVAVLQFQGTLFSLDSFPQCIQQSGMPLVMMEWRLWKLSIQKLRKI